MKAGSVAAYSDLYDNDDAGNEIEISTAGDGDTPGAVPNQENKKLK